MEEKPCSIASEKPASHKPENEMPEASMPSDPSIMAEQESLHCNVYMSCSTGHSCP